MYKKLLACLFLSFSFAAIFAQSNPGPKVLIVTSHPDDETTFPVTVYKIVHDLKGVADLALMTDGQGGYRNTELASEYYGLNLRDSSIGRTYLPAIRKRELMASGKIMGIRNFFFFDQVDDFYSQDPKPYVGGVKWDVAMIEKKLDQILSRTSYDYVLVLLPTPDQHGHHKTASLMALRAVKRFVGKNKPIVLGGLEMNPPELDTFNFSGLKDYPESRINKQAPVFTFHRTARFGFMNLVSYMIVHDWTIAEYKSQGDTQNNYMNKFGMEAFWFFDQNDESAIPKVQRLFEQLKSSGFATNKSK
ncbi:PIG-L family deacetylase [Segetibacter koreensis]|uniref:PIG-L family deacetylase n=1 Tax=Segetibacter koreensis TaxID=398037 RepID=UPI000361E350|nr:PIG-L family deacetylase [Segetibacter koreensis]